MAQPRRKRREEMPTKPHLMTGERRAAGREPGRGPAAGVRPRPARERRVPIEPGGKRRRSERGRPEARRPGGRTGPEKRPRKRPGRKGRATGAPLGRRRPNFDARRWRPFVLLVVVPVLLMLGSVYTHAAADGVSGTVAGLEEEREMAEVRQENLDLRLTELTAPERIRSEARDLGLEEPTGSVQVYGSQGEDGTDAAGPPGEERAR